LAPFAGEACSVLTRREEDGDDEKLWFARLNGGGFNPPCLAELKSSPSPSSPSSGPRSDPLLRFLACVFLAVLWKRCWRVAMMRSHVLRALLRELGK